MSYILIFFSLICCICIENGKYCYADEQFDEDDVNDEDDEYDEDDDDEEDDEDEEDDDDDWINFYMLSSINNWIQSSSWGLTSLSLSTIILVYK